MIKLSPSNYLKVSVSGPFLEYEKDSLPPAAPLDPAKDLTVDRIYPFDDTSKADCARAADEAAEMTEYLRSLGHTPRMSQYKTSSAFDLPVVGAGFGEE